tara:strand:+ start:191 stop:913 length:723 start_codon:yes stop_codon:yes gene_type:complete
MGVTDSLRWKRILNELIYLNEESEFVKSIIHDAYPEFQKYYNNFCERLSYDIERLNKKNSEKIRKMYGVDEEVEEVEQVKEALTEMQQQLVKYSEPKVLNSEPDPEPSNEYEMTKDEAELHECFRALFKKVAMELHPDRLSAALSTEEKGKKIAKFNAAKSALDDRKYFVVLEIAAELGIKTPKNYKQQIRWMKKEIEALKHAIAHSKTTYNYLFADCESEHEKDELIKKFMTQLFGINF